MVDFMILLVVAIIGAAIGIKLRLPVAPMIGAMSAVGMYNVLFDPITVSSNIKIFTQIINGAFIGSTVKREDILLLKELIVPAVSNTAIMLSFGVGMGLFIYSVTPYSLPTALFSCAPGGLVDMPLIAHDFGADVSIVAILQLVRVIVAMLILPFVLQKVLEKAKISKVESKDHATKEEKGEVKKENGIQHGMKDLFATLFFGAVGGMIGLWVGIPAGTLIFAMIFSAGFNIWTKRGYLPKKLKMGAQTLAGMLIGSSITGDTLVQMKALWIPVIILVVAYILLDLCMGYVLVKLANFDLPSALFACAPGGISDIALMATDYGANMMVVVALQTVRLFGSILLYPLLIQVIFP